MDKIELALQWALCQHQSQTDEQGAPFVLRAIEVGLMGQTDEEKCVGFLHLAINQNPQLYKKMIDGGFSKGLADTLLLFVAHDDAERVERIKASGNPLAMQVECYSLQNTISRKPQMQEKLQPLFNELQQTLQNDLPTEIYKISSTSETAIFAGGCFWGVQHEFEKENGVIRTLVGYTGGDEESPSYAQVRAQQTHHVEAVIIEYDRDVISYERLVQIFFEIHDPSQTDGVGPDIGAQYRSIIFYLTSQQKVQAQAVIEDLRHRGYEVNTLLLPSVPFWVGEKYHQEYYKKTGGEPYCHFRQKKF